MSDSERNIRAGDGDSDLSGQLLHELRKATQTMVSLQDQSFKGRWPWREGLLGLLSAVVIALASWVYHTDRELDLLQQMQITPLEQAGLLRNQTVLSTQMQDVQRRLADIEAILRNGR